MVSYAEMAIAEGRFDRASEVPPGEIECCDRCAAMRQGGRRMTLLGWQDYHATGHETGERP